MTTPARSVIVNPPQPRPPTVTAVVSRETCLRRAEGLVDELHALLAWLDANRDVRPRETALLDKAETALSQAREARNAGDVALVATHTERAQRALESFADLLGTGEETPLC